MVRKLHTILKTMGIHPFGWSTLAEVDGVTMPRLALTVLMAVIIRTTTVRIPQKPPHVS
jgi:hypothetical protein